MDYTLGTIDDLDPEDWQVPQHCIPIHANVTRYNWQPLIDHTHFDVVMMDPPWQLATANPTRGMCLCLCVRYSLGMQSAKSQQAAAAADQSPSEQIACSVLHALIVVLFHLLPLAVTTLGMPCIPTSPKSH